MTSTQAERRRRSTVSRRGRRGDPLARHRARTAYLFLLPAIAFFVVMFFYPLGNELITSLYTGAQAQKFVGLGNYVTSLSDPQVGILNRLLEAVGLPGQSLLNTHPLATITGIAIWQQVGYTTLLFLAGMQGIPEVYYEAARVDGAGPWQRFRKVTLPLLAPTTLFVSVIGVIASLQEFTLPYIVTDGGPGNATDLFVFRVYQTAFRFRDFGYASALSYLLLVVILILSVIQLRVGRRDYGT